MVSIRFRIIVRVRGDVMVKVKGRVDLGLMLEVGSVVG